jgi:hypothetical protein
LTARVFWARVAALALAAALCSETAAARVPVAVAVARGRALFTGREPLAGRVRDHRSDLPPAVVVCRGCHADRPVATGGATRPAPTLDRALLLQPRSRRGGPPSAYDLPTFCKLLRTGVDPAYILVAREMPVFDVDDPQCESLWRFLIGNGRAQ